MSQEVRPSSNSLETVKVRAPNNFRKEDSRVKLGPTKLDNGAIYEGEWCKGKRDGKGIMTQADGSKYDGEFVEDMCHGHGILNYANGDSYSGEWFQDRKHG